MHKKIIKPKQSLQKFQDGGIASGYSLLGPTLKDPKIALPGSYFGTNLSPIGSNTNLKPLTSATTALTNPQIQNSFNLGKTAQKAQNRQNRRQERQANGGFFGNALSKTSDLNSDLGGEISSAMYAPLKNLNSSLIGNEYTSNGAATANKLSSAVEDLGAKINPIGGATNQIGKSIGNLIGGTKDRVQGGGSAAVSAISTGLSALGPAGMVGGFMLNLINGIGGRRVSKLNDNTDQFGSGYSGSALDVKNSIDKYSNKKAGLFDFGFYKKGQNAINKARTEQNTVLNIMDNNKLLKSNTMAENYATQNQNRYSGAIPQLLLAKSGTKLPELEKARLLLQS